MTIRSLSLLRLAAVGLVAAPLAAQQPFSIESVRRLVGVGGVTTG